MIAANDEVTIFAMKNTFSKFQVLKMSAVGTFARRAFPAANLANRFSALEGDPFQNIHEAGKSKIGNFATPQSLHAVDVQIFKTHDIIFVAQIMSQLEMMLKPFVGNVRTMFGKRSHRAFVSVRPFDLARKVSIQLAGLTDILCEILRAGIACVFVVNQEGFESEVESAAFTRAGCSNDHLLIDSEYKPQPAHSIALDHQRFHLPLDFPVQNKFVFHAINCDGIATQFIARLWEGERGILDSLPKLWAALCQSFEETHICVVHTQNNILANLRVQIHPKRKPLRPAQFQNMLSHLVQGDIFPAQGVVPSLQSDEVIPNCRSNKYLMSQCAVFLITSVHSIFVLLVDFNPFAQLNILLVFDVLFDSC